MRGAAGGLQFGDKGQQRVVPCERAIFDGQINRAQIHRHHPARADVGVAHLGVAHLPGGQADIGAEGGQGGMRAIGPDPVEIRHVGLRRGADRRVRVDPPTIENAQNNGLAGHRGTFPECPLLLPPCRKSNAWLPARQQFCSGVTFA